MSSLICVVEYFVLEQRASRNINWAGQTGLCNKFQTDWRALNVIIYQSACFPFSSNSHTHPPSLLTCILLKRHAELNYWYTGNDVKIFITICMLSLRSTILSSTRFSTRPHSSLHRILCSPIADGSMYDMNSSVGCFLLGIFICNNVIVFRIFGTHMLLSPQFFPRSQRFIPYPGWTLQQ